MMKTIHMKVSGGSPIEATGYVLGGAGVEGAALLDSEVGWLMEVLGKMIINAISRIRRSMFRRKRLRSL